jgi:hypothetical protein
MNRKALGYATTNMNKWCFLVKISSISCALIRSSKFLANTALVAIRTDCIAIGSYIINSTTIRSRPWLPLHKMDVHRLATMLIHTGESGKKYWFSLFLLIKSKNRAHQTMRSGRLLRLGFNEVAQFLSKSEVLVALSVFSSPYIFFTNNHTFSSIFT